VLPLLVLGTATLPVALCDHNLAEVPVLERSTPKPTGGLSLPAH
jgi:hypothetical protein